MTTGSVTEPPRRRARDGERDAGRRRGRVRLEDRASDDADPIAGAEQHLAKREAPVLSKLQPGAPAAASSSSSRGRMVDRFPVAGSPNRNGPSTEIAPVPSAIENEPNACRSKTVG